MKAPRDLGRCPDRTPVLAADPALKGRHMTGVHVSIAALLVAAGQLLTAIGQKNAPAFYASVTAILACFLPSVLAWLKPETPPVKPS